MTMVYVGIGVVVVVMILVVLRGTSSEAPPANLTDDQIRATAMAGQKIQAIKWYRQLHSVGLKEAKDAVEAMIK